MNWQFLYKIWRPDTYIVNGQKSYLHKMTVPNRFIRISPDGTIYYSQRLTVKARCEMDLHKFPLDDQVRFCRQVSGIRTSCRCQRKFDLCCQWIFFSFSQECPLEIGSFGHDSGDIQYHWQANNPISQEDVGLAQYLLGSCLKNKVPYITRSAEIQSEAVLLFE